MRAFVQKFSLAIPAILLCSALVVNSANAQSNLSFLADTPVSDLTTAQLDSLYGAIKTSLNAGVDGKTSQWSAGAKPAPSATITPTFDKGESKCATVMLSITAERTSQPVRLRYCKSAAGEWALHN